MGTEWKQVKVVATVSRHNSPKDRFHDAAWEYFLDQLELLVKRDDFKCISLMID